MPVLVSDTSVIIDLERGALLETAFRLPFELAVPDLLFDKELKGYGGEDLINLGLRVEELDEDGVGQAVEYRTRRPALSLPDCFALALAKANEWTLLSGDGPLRQMAAEENIACHGVLWMLDHMEASAVANAAELLAGLEAISNHHRCRLPRRQVTLRLGRYREG